jgi:hypothetical protein
MPKRRKRNHGSSSRSKQHTTTISPGRSIKPPQISSNVHYRHKYRFAAGTSGSGLYNITNNDILLAMGGLCTVANSTITAICASFKIRSVEVWGTVGAAPATVSINWNGSPVFVANLEKSDTSVSPAYPPYIRAHPPPNSNAKFWQTAGTGVIFALTVVNSSIIDLDVEGVWSDQQDVDTVTGVSTATLGAQYFLALDGAASNQLVPQSLSTTH